MVSGARLVDDLWGARAPDTAPKMVQIHVSALRKVLPPGVLVTRAPGYAVDLPREAVDAFRAEDALRAGRDALAAGDARRASEVLAGALALWRGPALEEFREPFAEGEARRLEELRLALTEERLAADLALGRHADANREIEALVAAEPLRERLRELQMVALYRSGRQAEALAAYQDAFRALNEELGIEPSARLRELERAVLRQDPSLDAPAAAPRRRAPSLPRARRPSGATPARRPSGRCSPLAADGATRVVLVTGEAGAGKTTLVDALLDGLPDGAALVGRGQCVVAARPVGGVHAGAPGAGAHLPGARRAGTPCRADRRRADVGGADAVAARRRGARGGGGPPGGARTATGCCGRASRRSPGSPRAARGAGRRGPPVGATCATVDLIAALARHRGPARLVVLDHDAAARRRARRRDPGRRTGPRVARLATEVALGGLGDAEVARYLASRLPGAEVPADLAGLLRARTGGIPLFLEKAVNG